MPNSKAKQDYFVGDKVEFELQRGPRRGEWLRGIVVARVPGYHFPEPELPDGLGFVTNSRGPNRSSLSYLIRRDGAKPCKSVYWPPVAAVRRAK